jgi:hypothetical protein
MYFETLSIRPIPERLLDPESKIYRAGMAPYTKGGCYLTQEGNDVTGTTVAWACIDIRSKDVFKVRGVADPQSRGPLVRTNLFRKEVGWKWVETPCDDLDVLISVETRGSHHYAVSAVFECPLTLTRYADKKTEPRLRPTTRGTVSLGPIFGLVSIRSRDPVPVYESVCVTP